MPIKDKDYWKEYNAKRKAYIQQKNKERYNQDKGCINATNQDATISEKIQPIKIDTTFNTTDATKNNTTTDATKEVVLDATIQPHLPSCSRCAELEKATSRLQRKIDDCDKRHTIPKEADFINLMWDKNHQKFIFYGCADSCWTGKYCNNCSSLEEKLINKINQKYYEKQ